MRFLWSFQPSHLAMGCVLALALTPARAEPASQAFLTIDRAVALAVADSRRVVATEAQALASRERSIAAGQRTDPVLKLGLNNLPIDGADRYSVTRDFMTMRSVGVMQEFTRADKLGARRDRAEREVGLANAMRRETVAEVQRDTALAWLERSYQETVREQLRQQIEQAEAQVQAAEVQYRSGRGAQADVYAARSEVEAINDRVDEVDREIAVATTRMARWIGDAAREPLAARPAWARPAWYSAAQELPIDRHPAVAAQRELEAVAESDVRLAAANRRADWSIELQYSQRGPAYSNMVSVNLSVPLQWDQKNRQDRELAAKQAMAEQARAQREDSERATRAELSAGLAQWRSHEQRLRRHDQALLPLAQQRSEAALAAYAAGSGSLVAVMQARRNALQVHLDRVRIELDIARLWAQFAYVLPQEPSRSGSPQTSQESATTSRITP